MPPKFPRDFQPTVLRNSVKSFALYLRDCHTLWSSIPAVFDLGKDDIETGPITPHVPYVSIRDSV